MKNTFVNVSGKLPPEMVQLYREVSEHAERLGIDFLVVGAMARDLVLVNGFGSSQERGTRDVDFGIKVASWKEFDALRNSLLQAGYQPTRGKLHRLIREDKQDSPWEIDIIPFGNIADINNEIHWPPAQHFAMNVLGFSEAHEHALQVQITAKPNIILPVASPAGMCLLKLVSWLDREVELRPKDAIDFEYLIRSYSEIKEIYDLLYEEGYMEAQDWEKGKATAAKLGREAGAIASTETARFLEKELFNNTTSKEKFMNDMQNQAGKNLMDCAERFDLFAKEFSLASKHR